MKYVLDTDILSLWQVKHPLVVRRVREHKAEGIVTTIITIEEQYDGWKKRIKKAERRELVSVYTEMLKAVRLFAELPILTYSDAACDLYEELLTGLPILKRLENRCHRHVERGDSRHQQHERLPPLYASWLESRELGQALMANQTSPIQLVHVAPGDNKPASGIRHGISLV